METTIIHELNNLLLQNLDTIQGYKKAKKVVSSIALPEYFQVEIENRQQFMKHLSTEMKKLGSQPLSKESIADASHEAWANFMPSTARKGDVKVVHECIKTEEENLAEYESLICSRDILKGNLKSILLDQKEYVKECIDELKIIRKSINPVLCVRTS